MRSDSGFSIDPGGRRGVWQRARISDDYHAALDLEGRFVAVSEHLAACLGTDTDTLVGMDLERVVDAETPKAVLDDLWRTLASGGSWSAAVRLRTMRGDVLWMSLTAVPDNSRGLTQAYLVHLRPAFEREIADAREDIDRLARGAVFDRGRCRATGPAGWFRQLLRGPREGVALRLGVPAICVALAGLVISAGWSDAGDRMLRLALLVVLAILLLVALGAIVLDARRRRREHVTMRDAIERIARGETDFGNPWPGQTEAGAVIDALRKLQLKLSMSAAGFEAQAAGGRLDCASPPFLPAVVEGLRRLELRCAALGRVLDRSGGARSDGESDGDSRLEQLAAVLDRVEAMNLTVSGLGRTSLQSRVLGLNLALLATRVEVKGLGRASATASSVARETRDGLVMLEEEMVRLKRELHLAVDALSSEEQGSTAVPDAFRDGLAELLLELRVLRATVETGHDAGRGVADVTVPQGKAEYPRKPVEHPEAVDRGSSKVARLKAVGSAPVPRVGRGKRGGPLEDDWRG